MGEVIGSIGVEFSGETSTLKKALDKATRDAERTAKSIAKAFRSLEAPKHAQQTMETWSKAVEKLGGVSKLTAPQVEILRKKIEGLQRAGAKVPAALEGITRQASKLQAVSGKMVSAGNEMSAAGRGLLPLSAAIAGVGVGAVKMATDFNRSMSEVATLIPGNTKRVLELKGEVQDLAKETGKSTRDLAGGLYQTISAFGDTSDTAKKLGINARAAAAGLATTTDAIDLTSAVTKGYGDTSAEAVQKAADLAFMTVKMGQTTFPELAASIGQVVPVAAALNVKQEELYAGFATLTGVTGNTTEVSTQLKAIMSSMLKPSEDMAAAMKSLGVESVDTMVKQYGLIGAMQKLIAQTDGSKEAVAKLFPNLRAITPVLALAGSQAENFADRLQSMGRASGAAEEAYEEFISGLGRAAHAWDTAKQRIVTSLQKLGDAIAPTLLDIADALDPLIDNAEGIAEAFGKLPAPVRGAALAISAVAAAAGPALFVMGSMTSGLGSLLKASGAARAGLTALHARIVAIPPAATAMNLALKGGAIFAVAAVAYEGGRALSALGDQMRGVNDRVPVKISFFEMLEGAPSLIWDVVMKIQELGGAWKAAFELTMIPSMARTLSYIQDISDGFAKMLYGADGGKTASIELANEQRVLNLALEATGKRFTDVNEAWKAYLAAKGDSGKVKSVEALKDALGDALIKLEELSAADADPKQIAEYEKRVRDLRKAIADAADEPPPPPYPPPESSKAATELRSALRQLETEQVKQREGIDGIIARIDLETGRRIEDAAAAGIQGKALEKLSATYLEIGEIQKAEASKEWADKQRASADAAWQAWQDFKKAMATVSDEVATSFDAIVESETDFVGTLKDPIFGEAFGDLIPDTVTAKTTTEELAQATQLFTDILGLIPGLADSAFGKVVSSAGAAISAAGSLKDAFSLEKDEETGQMVGKSLGTKLLAGLGAAGAAIGIGKSVVGAVVGAFKKVGWKEASKEISRDFQTEVSEALAKAVDATAKSLDIGRFEASLLHIGDIMAEGLAQGVEVGEFRNNIQDLFNAISMGVVPAEQGIESLGDAWSQLTDKASAGSFEAKRMMVEMMQTATAAGTVPEQMRASMEAGVDDLVAGITEVMGGLENIGKAEGELIGATFWSALASDGLVGASDALKDAFSQFAEKAGPAARKAMGGAMRLMNLTQSNEVFRGAAQTFEGLTKMTLGMEKSNMVTAESFRQLGASAMNAYKQALGQVGEGHEKDAIAAALPYLAQARQTASLYGVELDANTKKLIEQAEAAGYAFPEEPQQVMIQLLSQMVELMGGKVPEAARTMGESLTSSAEGSSDAMSSAVGGISDTLGQIPEIASETLGKVPEIAGAAMSTTLETVGSSMESTAGLVEGAIAPLEGSIGSVFEAIADRTGDSMLDMVGNAESSTEAIREAIERLGDLRVQIPVDISGGLGGGIQMPLPPKVRVPGFAGGSAGFRNFGASGTLTMLHDVEAVIRPGDLERPPFTGRGGRAGGGRGEVAQHFHISGEQKSPRQIAIEIARLQDSGGIRTFTDAQRSAARRG